MERKEMLELAKRLEKDYRKANSFRKVPIIGKMVSKKLHLDAGFCRKLHYMLSIKGVSSFVRYTQKCFGISTEKYAGYFFEPGDVNKRYELLKELIEHLQETSDEQFNRNMEVIYT